MPFFEQDGQNKRLWVRQNDTRPQAEVQLILDSDGTYYDVSSGSGFIEVYKTDGTTLLSGQSLDLSAGATGYARYPWTAGQLATLGTYRVVMRIDPDGSGNYLSVPEEPYEYVLRVI